MELYPAMQDAVHDLVALVEEYSNMAVERQCDGAFRRNYQEVNAHHAFRNHTDQLFVKMMSTRPEISFAEYDGVTYYFEIAPEYRLEEEHSECRILSQEEVDIMCAKHFLYLHDSGGEQANFSGCLLRNINLSGRKLNGAVFDGAELIDDKLFTMGIKSQILVPNQKDWNEDLVCLKAEREVMEPCQSIGHC